MAARASIIIVSWNGEPYLADCLDAILSQTSPDDETIVVDNASTDGSAALVREGYPQVRLIENTHNLGFAGGCNVGLRAALGECLVLVNQDVVVREGWLEAMLSALAPPEVGIVGGRLLYPDGTIQHAGGIVRYPLAHTNHHGYREPDQGQWDTPREVDYVIGASLGLRRDVLDKIGLFDEGFFPAFYEETDLCFRARAAGYRVMFTPDAVGMHRETTTVAREGVDYHHWMGRGRLRFVLKHHTAQQFHDDFVPAERLWLAELADPIARQGLRMAYLDTLLSLQGVPRTGVLSEGEDVEEIAEVLLDLQEMIVAPSEVTTPASPLLTGLPWHVEERPFTSKVPIVGPFIARLRELWNNISTKWYVRPLVEQQNEFNRQLVEQQNEINRRLAEQQGQANRRLLEYQQELNQQLVLATVRLQERLAAVQEILVCLDREMTGTRRLQTEAMCSLREEVDRLRAQVDNLEETLSTPSGEEVER